MVKSVTPLSQSTQGPPLIPHLLSDTLLASVKAHLRTKIYEELHRHSTATATATATATTLPAAAAGHTFPPSTSHPTQTDENYGQNTSLESLVVDLLVAQHLRSQRLVHALRVFTAETGHQGALPALPPADLLHLVGIQRDSPHHTAALKPLNTLIGLRERQICAEEGEDGRQESILRSLVRLIAHLTANPPAATSNKDAPAHIQSQTNHIEAATNKNSSSIPGTEEEIGNGTVHILKGSELERRLETIETIHERRCTALMAQAQAGVASRLAEIDRAYQHRLAAELQMQVEAFKSSELARLRQEANLHYSELSLRESKSVQLQYHKRLAAVRAEAEAVLSRQFTACKELDEQRAQLERKVVEEEMKIQQQWEAWEERQKREEAAMATRLAEEQSKIDVLKQVAAREEEQRMAAAAAWEVTKAVAQEELQRQQAAWEESKTRESCLLAQQRSDWECKKAAEELELAGRKEAAAAAVRAAEATAQQREKDAHGALQSVRALQDRILELYLQIQHKDVVIESFRKELEESKYGGVQQQLRLQAQLQAAHQELKLLQQQAQLKQVEAQAAVQRYEDQREGFKELEAKLSVGAATQTALQRQLEGLEQRLVESQAAGRVLLQDKTALEKENQSMAQQLQNILSSSSTNERTKDEGFKTKTELRNALQLLDMASFYSIPPLTITLPALDGQEQTLRHAEDLRLDAVGGMREITSLREVAEQAARLAEGEPLGPVLVAATEAARKWEESALNRAEKSRSREDTMRATLTELRRRSAAAHLTAASLFCFSGSTTAPATSTAAPAVKASREVSQAAEAQTHIEINQIYDDSSLIKESEGHKGLSQVIEGLKEIIQQHEDDCLVTIDH